MERLGAYIRERRGELRLKQAELGELVEVSVKTVNNWETARTGAPRAGTAAALERALGWEPGSIRTVLLGGEPTVTSRNPRPLPEVAQQPVGLGLDADADGLTADDVAPIRAALRELRRQRGLE